MTLGVSALVSCQLGDLGTSCVHQLGVGVRVTSEAPAPIDGFGVGTRMVVSDDVPHIDMAYKLVEYAGRGRTKLATAKIIYPGRKQVFRRVENGVMIEDGIGVLSHNGVRRHAASLIRGPVRGAGYRMADLRRRDRSTPERSRLSLSFREVVGG